MTNLYNIYKNYAPDILGISLNSGSDVNNF